MCMLNITEINLSSKVITTMIDSSKKLVFNSKGLNGLR